jgi:putative phosphoribosyl transferase
VRPVSCSSVPAVSRSASLATRRPSWSRSPLPLRAISGCCGLSIVEETYPPWPALRASGGEFYSSPMEVDIPAGRVSLAGDLVMPPGAAGVVAFAHGSGSGRFSPRNRQVAAALQDRGLGTILMDLLTEEEEAVDRSTGRLRFDIGLLSDRVIRAVDWLIREAPSAGPALSVGVFGASTGAAAALVAAAGRAEAVGAVVSRGGRPDLAADVFSTVRAPTLLIVGGNDPIVLDLNRQAMARMTAETKLEVIPGATHLFEEPGALEEVARLAADWFEERLLSS